MSKLKTYKLSNLYEMSSGISSKPEQAGHGSQFVSFKTVFNNYFLPDVLSEYMDISEKEKDIYSIKKGDIFLTRTSETLDELGMSCVAIKDYPASSFSGFLKRLRPTQDDITYDKFMAFYLRSDLFRKTMTNNSIMTLRASLNEQIFSYLELILPDFKDQKKAGDFLYSLNAKIELNNKINAELEAMAKTLYDYWFVQFDFPDDNGKPYKTSGGKMVWNEELKREIPDGWEIETLDKVMRIIRGASPRPIEKFISSSGMPWIKISDATKSNNRFIISTKEFIKKDGVSKSRELQSGTLILSNSASPGIPKIVNINACVHDGWLIIDSFKKEFYNEFMFHYFENFRGKILNMGSGSIFKNLKTEYIKELLVAVPPEELLLKSKKLFKNISDQILENAKQNQELASLRDWLLPMLMNGQVRVSDVEEEFDMVAEPIEIYKKAKKKVVEKVKKTNTPAIKLNPVDVYKRTLLAAEIVFQLKDTYTLGHLKLQKMLYLCQEIENMSLPMNFLKQAMGPYDNQLARSLDKQFMEKKWFLYQREEALKYKPLENCGKHHNDFNKYFEDQLEGINYLIKKFTKFTSNQIEAVATLYACWKEAIENKELINDKLIITKFYNWSKEKEKFKEENLVEALVWMRKNGIEPKISPKNL